MGLRQCIIEPEDTNSVLRHGYQSDDSLFCRSFLALTAEHKAGGGCMDVFHFDWQALCRFPLIQLKGFRYDI